jgi:hypothetical protein
MKGYDVTIKETMVDHDGQLAPPPDRPVNNACVVFAGAI